MGGSISPISAILNKQQQAPEQAGGVGYQAPAPANVYRQQQAPTQMSPFVQQQMQRGLGQQQYVSPLQSMLSRILSGYNPQQFNQQQFNPQGMMQQGMPPQGYGQMYRPNMGQVQQNLARVAPPVMPPAPTPEPVAEPQVAAGGGGD